MPVIVIGTSHIAQESITAIKRAIADTKPNFIAVELDIKRLHALASNQQSKLSLRDISHVGVKGFLFAFFGSLIQRKLGKLVGLAPGSDMLQAVKIAQREKIPLLLIDQDINITLRRFSDQLSWADKFHFIEDMVRGLLFPKSEIKKYDLHTLDLRKIPSTELVEKMIGQLKKRYPSIYRVLIAERNHVMIQRLRNISAQHPAATILVVVGAGHKSEIEKAFRV